MNRRHALAPTVMTVVLLALTACSAEVNTREDEKPGSLPATTATPSAPVPGVAGGPADRTPLIEAIDLLTVAPETEGDYNRRDFKHWNTGLDEGDGCDTREELLVAEAIKPPTKGEGCKLTGGQWLSYYDGVTVEKASALDVDHMVPLEEAWSSGAHDWDTNRREAYANDLDAQRSLVAVTAKTNRSKGRKDPAEWLPPSPEALCIYRLSR
ncbi:GmrSD restriction endonuclease domain-containing protein [Streptomyces sp. NPDC002835]